MQIIKLAATTVALLVSGSVALAVPVPVTTCGQVVQGTGQLIADLDCSAVADDAVKLAGRLLLGGFALTGHPAFDVVRCQSGACRVTGPGTVTGGVDGIRSDRSARVEAGAEVTGNSGDGVRTDKAAKVVDASVTANGGDGVRSKTTATILGSTISGNGADGVRADGSVTIKESTVDGNGGHGVDSNKNATAKLSSVGTNGLDGLRGLRAKLIDATALGNGTSPTCSLTDDCADLASTLPPAVRGTSSCGTSRNIEAGGSWGVCSND